MKQISTITEPEWRELRILADSSRALIRNLQHESGAYPASPSFSAYVGFSWLRDGAFIADAMSTAGEGQSAERFFDWCAQVIAENKDPIFGHYEQFLRGGPFNVGNALPTRFAFEDSPTPDEPWPDHQIDGYGAWIWALHQHLLRSPKAENRWSEAIQLSVKYLLASWESPCYDWWEEHPTRVHTATLGSVLAGLKAAHQLDTLDGELSEQTSRAIEKIENEIEEVSARGYLVKWNGSPQVDSSTLSILAPFELINPDSEVFDATLTRVKETLMHEFGLHRYDSDSFYGGGLWPLLSCYLGLAELRNDNVEIAEQILLWVHSLADKAGHLPEQVNHHLVKRSMEQPWINRWGESAKPLLWSHAMYLKLMKEIEHKND